MKKSSAPPKGFYRTSFNCPNSLYRAAKRRAKEHRRSVSGHIQHLIEEDLKRAAMEQQDETQAA